MIDSYIKFLNTVKHKQEIAYNGEVFRVILGPSQSPDKTAIIDSKLSHWCYYIESDFTSKRFAVTRYNYMHLELLEDKDLESTKVIDCDITEVPFRFGGLINVSNTGK